MGSDEPPKDPRKVERRWVTGVAVTFGVLALVSVFSRALENLVGLVLLGAVALIVLVGVVRFVLGEWGISRACRGAVTAPDLKPRYYPGSVKDRAQRGMPPKDEPTLRMVDE